MSRILIKNPLILAVMDDAQTEFSGGHILIEDGIITSISPETTEIDTDEVIDASSCVVLPGFVNTHHHLFQTLTRNVPRMQNAPLFPWLVDHYEVWRELREEAAFVSAKTGLLEMMKSGVTTSSDHLYLFPSKSDGRLIDAEIRAARELNVRFQPTRGSMSLGRSAGGLPPDDVVQSEDAILADMQRLVDEYHDPQPGAMIRISIAPCSPFSVTSDEMRRTAEFAMRNQLQMHTHLAETEDEQNFCIEQFGLRPVAYMESVGWLSDNAWFAHTVHLSDDEIVQMGQAGVSMSHCPTSNMRLGSGIAPVKKLLQAGAGVSLGVDGSASNDSCNMLSEIRNAMLISRLLDESDWLTARDAFWVATRGGAKALGRDDIGSLEVGKCADLAIFDMSGIEYAGALSDPLAALVFCVRMSTVTHLVVDGKIVIRDSQTHLDETAMAVQHQGIADEMFRRAGERTGMDFLGQADQEGTRS
jgi:8-oxoguanine deaminase